jgi:hypothetical protein
MQLDGDGGAVLLQEQEAGCISALCWKGEAGVLGVSFPLMFCWVIP